MIFEEMAVKIEKEIEKFINVQIIYRFIVLCFFYHVNSCQRTNCDNCKFTLELY